MVDGNATKSIMLNKYPNKIVNWKVFKIVFKTPVLVKKKTDELISVKH